MISKIQNCNKHNYGQVTLNYKLNEINWGATKKETRMNKIKINYQYTQIMGKYDSIII